MERVRRELTSREPTQSSLSKIKTFDFRRYQIRPILQSSEGFMCMGSAIGLSHLNSIVTISPDRTGPDQTRPQQARPVRSLQPFSFTFFSSITHDSLLSSTTFWETPFCLIILSVLYSSACVLSRKKIRMMQSYKSAVKRVLWIIVF